MATKSIRPDALENATDLLIALLYAPGKSGKFAEPVEGITRLQKLMFLLQQGVGPKQLVDEAISYGYKPYKMGPYANGLQRDLNELQAAGIVNSERLNYWLPDDADANSETAGKGGREKQVESYKFYLSDWGRQIGADIWSQLPAKVSDDLITFKRFFNRLTLRQLLIFTYERFPKFTSESVIKDQLGLD